MPQYSPVLSCALPAGAIETPALLMRSGIGPANTLKQVSVKFNSLSAHVPRQHAFFTLNPRVRLFPPRIKVVYGGLTAKMLRPLLNNVIKLQLSC